MPRVVEVSSNSALIGCLKRDDNIGEEVKVVLISLGCILITTDYVGRIQAVSRIHRSGDATTNRNRQRTLDIHNLSSNIIGPSLWHEMATEFNVQEYETMEKPIVIAVYRGSTIHWTMALRHATSFLKLCSLVKADIEKGLESDLFVVAHGHDMKMT
ncbi:hypothetical protein Tco_1308624 [Tanacetum coccineum]